MRHPCCTPIRTTIKNQVYLRLDGFLDFVLPTPCQRQDDLTKSSIVKLTVTQRSFDHSRPWAKSNATDVSGTGFVISGKRIITNAHVVRYASQIYVQLKGSDEKLEAKVQAIAHDLTWQSSL